MNKVILMGRTTKDADIKSGEMTVARFTLAVDRRTKDKATDFISCVAFGKTAEFIQKYISKGTKVLVTGSIRTGSYTNKEGQKVYTTDIVVTEIEFAESKKTDEPPATDDFIQVPEGIESELPFK